MGINVKAKREQEKNPRSSVLPVEAYETQKILGCTEPQRQRVMYTNTQRSQTTVCLSHIDRNVPDMKGR